MILPCFCDHTYQDEHYGLHHRVHNPAKGPNNTVVYRCTVCGRERERGATDKAKGKGK